MDSIKFLSKLGNSLCACRLIFLATALLLVIGCATPQARIHRNPGIFESLQPKVQTKVADGEIEVGFPKDAVFLALGAPDRRYTRTTGEGGGGETLIWSYVRSYPAYDGTWAPYHRHRVLVTTGIGTHWHDTALTHGFFYDYIAQEYEYLRVEFKDGEVVAIERLTED